MQNTEYFDGFGRCIPRAIKADCHSNTRRYFICEQPNIECDKIHARLVKHLAIDNPITIAEFTDRAEKILAALRNDPQCKNLLNGVHVPIMLPKDSYSDLGEHFEEKYVGAVKSSFEENSPGRSFVNHHKAGLSGKLKIAPGSRHDQLIAAMQKDLVVAYYFPCLNEYSVPAAIQQIGQLPENFLLAGGFDTAAALVGSPDLLLRAHGYPPLLWLAGLEAEGPGVGYHFEAYGYNLTFNRRVHFDKAAESWASGIVVIG